MFTILVYVTVAINLQSIHRMWIMDFVHWYAHFENYFCMEFICFLFRFNTEYSVHHRNNKTGWSFFKLFWKNFFTFWYIKISQIHSFENFNVTGFEFLYSYLIRKYLFQLDSMKFQIEMKFTFSVPKSSNNLHVW